MQYFLSMVMPAPSVERKTYIFTEISKEDMKLKKMAFRGLSSPLDP